MIIKIIETYYKIRFMEPGCTYNTVASNNTAQFRYKAKTNALGKAAIAPKTKTNEKANCFCFTTYSEATNFSIYSNDNDENNDCFEFILSINQTKTIRGIIIHKNCMSW